MWTPIDGRGLTIPALATYIRDSLEFPDWKPSGMVLHNTAAPTLAQWHNPGGKIRIANLVDYFKNVRGWSAGPHAFVADDLVWLFTPFNKRGVHSPSWNGTRLGIEMVGDYDNEAFDSGGGAKVRDNTVALFALLHAKLGIDPETIKLHKEDPKTTHACPGRHVNKADFISRVVEYMGIAGDHHTTSDVEVRRGVVNTPGDTLNARDIPSARGKIVGRLADNFEIEIVGSAVNGSTTWLRILPLNAWVSAHYVKES